MVNVLARDVGGEVSGFEGASWEGVVGIAHSEERYAARLSMVTNMFRMGG